MRRMGYWLAGMMLVWALGGCSGDDGGGGDGGSDTGAAMDTGGGGDAFSCTRHIQCRQRFDNKPVCDLDGAESASGCRGCELSNECPGTRVCWTGGETPQCVTDCEEDMSVCESGETCEEITETDGTTVYGCVPS